MEANRFLAVDRSELYEGGRPVVVWDEHGRVVFRGTCHSVGPNAIMKFDMAGPPIVDAAAKVWIEWKE